MMTAPTQPSAGSAAHHCMPGTNMPSTMSPILSSWGNVDTCCACHILTKKQEHTMRTTKPMPTSMYRRCDSYRYSSSIDSADETMAPT